MAKSVVAVALLATPAAAGGDPAVLGGSGTGGMFFKLGFEGGGAFGRDRGADAVAGAIATFVSLNQDGTWAGLQGDLLADGNGDAASGARWTIGPEFGKWLIGGDISYAGERVAGETHHGVAVRAKLTAGVVAVYFRFTKLQGDDGTSFDAGLQLKYPFRLGR